MENGVNGLHGPNVIRNVAVDFSSNTDTVTIQHQARTAMIVQEITSTQGRLMASSTLEI